MTDVGGTVTLKSGPLDQGEIVFVSDKGLPCAMQVVSGRFAGKAVVGRNKVQISSLEERPNPHHNAATPGSTPMVRVNVIPAAYAAESKEYREIEAGKSNSFEFTIK